MRIPTNTFQNNFHIHLWEDGSEFWQLHSKGLKDLVKINSVRNVFKEGHQGKQ